MDPGPWLFLAGFALLWCAVSVLLSFVSGWHGLARYHRAFDAVEGESFRFASGAIGFGAFPVGYNNCLNVTLNRTGFRLAVFPLFRLLAPPLFISWRDVAAVEVKQSFRVRYAVVRLRGDGPQIRLRGEAGTRLLDTFASLDASTR